MGQRLASFFQGTGNSDRNDVAAPIGGHTYVHGIHSQKLL
jgi:hypothetical protein